MSTLDPPTPDPDRSNLDSPNHAPPNPEYVRSTPGVTLVGVVHDHPASVTRVRSVLATERPAVLALELPPMALLLYQEYARDSRSPPIFGGEMSAAIQATDARVIGIDGPSRRFAGALCRYARRERPSLRAFARLVSGACRASRHAIRCRIAASIARRTGVLEVDSPRSYDCIDDSLERQAADERGRVSRATTALQAFALPHVARRDDVREECMAEAIENARTDGGVVAVVGIDHLDGLASRLQ